MPLIALARQVERGALPRGGLSHTLSHGLSHGLSHDLSIGPIIPSAREGRRRMFSESDKQQILEKATHSRGKVIGRLA